MDANFFTVRTKGNEEVLVNANSVCYIEKRNELLSLIHFVHINTDGPLMLEVTDTMEALKKILLPESASRFLATKRETGFIELPLHNGGKVLVNECNIAQILPMKNNSNCQVYFIMPVNEFHHHYIETTLGYEEIKAIVNVAKPPLNKKSYNLLDNEVE